MAQISINTSTLAGYAAWCVTPIGGLGTTASPVRACLRGKLTRTPDLATAYAAYEQAMRPMVEKAQAVPDFAPPLANPHSRLGIRALHGALAPAGRPAIRSIAGKLPSGRLVKPDLTHYDDPVPMRETAPVRMPKPFAGPRGALPPVAALGIVGFVLGVSAMVSRRNAPDPSHPNIRRW